MRFLTIRGKLIEKYTIRGLLIFMGILFISSIIVGQVENNEQELPPMQEVLEYSYTFLPGGPMEPDGNKYDCSGFTRAVYSRFDISLPPSSAGQFDIARHTGRDSITTGDLLFFNTSGNGISHVAISIDSIRFIHSPGIGRSVKIDSLTQEYWDKRFIGAGRINFINPTL